MAAWVQLSSVQFFPIAVASVMQTVKVTAYCQQHPLTARSADALDAALRDHERWLQAPERQAAA
jgi:hypothetical protein